MLNHLFFESIKLFNGEIYNIEYHNKRLNDTIHSIFKQKSNLDLRDFILTDDVNLLKCKVVYSNKIENIQYSCYEKKNINSLKIVKDDGVDYSFKFFNRENIQYLYMQKGNYDDIIIVKNGFVTDTSIANIALLINDKWITPKVPLLKGTTRQRYIDNKFLIEDDVSIDMLKGAKKIALMNAMIDFYILDEVKII